MILFHLKSSFCSWDIQIFVFQSSPPFFPVGHCFRGWSKINLKVYVIHFLNKNLITHFVWYLEKGKRNDSETLSIDRIPGFQLAIHNSRIASQFTVTVNHFFLFLIKSRIKNHIFSFTKTCLFILFSTLCMNSFKKCF